MVAARVTPGSRRQALPPHRNLKFWRVVMKCFGCDGGEETLAALDATLAARLSNELERTLKGVAGPAQDCALVLYRDTKNVGDAAIWIAAVRVLRRLGFNIRYTSTVKSFQPFRLRRCVPTGPIFINGGGSLGRYPRDDALMKAVFREFANRKIVVLPQSAGFADHAAFDSFAKEAETAEDLTILCRDRSTYDAVRELRCTQVQCPDLVTSLWDYPMFEWAPSRGSNPHPTCVVLLRQDSESRGFEQPQRWPLRVDWETPPIASTTGLGLRLLARIERLSSAQRSSATLGAYVRTTRARMRLSHGLRLLAGTRVIVTDRLHGAVFAFLMGIPCVVLDNNWGKVRAFFDTWFDGVDGMKWADDLDQAVHIADELSARSRS